MKKVLKYLKQFLCYVGGLFLIALGINISKVSALGISPVSSVPRACEVIWGFTLGTTTMIIYCILILLQIIILRKKFRLINLLGIAVTFLFSWLVDLTGTDPNAFGHLLINIYRPTNYLIKLLYLIGSLFVIAIGVFLYLRPSWIPMPAEGLAGAISQVSGKAFGDCKTIVDSSLISIALIIQIVCLFFGNNYFYGPIIIVREGTILAAICVGQIVKLLSKYLGKYFDIFLEKNKKVEENTEVKEEENNSNENVAVEE